MALQIRRGSTADRLTKKFAQGELVFDTTLNEVFIGDSTDGVNGTSGGRPVTSFTSDQAKDAAAATLSDNSQHTNITFTYNSTTKKLSASVPADAVGITSVQADTSPDLGGNLNLNSNNINGTGNVNITGSVTTTGDIQTTAGSLKGTHIGVIRSGDGSTIVVNNGTNGTDAVFNGNLNGNASTVTNGVVTTGSYANPSWITSLAGSKVTDAVLTTGSYANPSWITSLAGSKVTDAVLTTGSYANPSWITSLAGSKVTDAVLTTGSYANPSWITSLAGSKVTDAVLTTGSYADPSWITSLSFDKIVGTLTSDQIIEGVVQQFFTVEKARLAINSGDNISYDPVTGSVSLFQTISDITSISTLSVTTDDLIVTNIINTDNLTTTGNPIDVLFYGYLNIQSGGIVTPELNIVNGGTASAELWSTYSRFFVPLTLAGLTTTERDAIDAALKIQGTVIFNTTNQKFQGYVNDVGLATSGVANSTPGWVNFTVTAA